MKHDIHSKGSCVGVINTGGGRIVDRYFLGTTLDDRYRMRGDATQADDGGVFIALLVILSAEVNDEEGVRAFVTRSA